MSDAELDDDLLALAGEDGGAAASDEGHSPSKARAGDSASPPPRHSPSPSPKAPSPPPRDPTPKSPSPPPRQSIEQPSTTSTMPAAKQAQRTSPKTAKAPSPAPSHDSLGSGAMSESESDDSEGQAPSKPSDGAVFPVEGRFYSQKDKAEIMAMSEIKREEILAERAAEAERRTQDLHLRRLLQAREKDEAKLAEKSKRKAAVADLDDSPRKSSRTKTKANESLEAYKRQREQRNRDRRQEDDRKTRKKKSPSQDKDGLSPDASDLDWDEAQSKEPSSKQEQEPELQDYNRIRIGRSNFAKYCYTPRFEETVPGCLVRVNIGPNKDGDILYRMTQIKSVTTGKRYVVDNPNGKPFYTNQWLVLAHGKAEKTWQFNYCSDGRFTEEEFTRFKRVCAEDGVRVPTMNSVEKKIQGINDLINHHWTDAEITEKIKRSGAEEDKYRSINLSQLRNMRGVAETRGDEEQIADLDRQIAEIERPDKPVLLEPPKQKSKDMGDRLSEINQKNRIINSKNVREALIREKHARRGEQLSRAGTPANGSKTGTPAGSRSGTPLPASVKKPNAAGFRSRNYDDEIMASIDLGIEIDI